jgi:microsomal epoxide hydrolase
LGTENGPSLISSYRRSVEDDLNSYPNYTLKIDDLDIHFIALFSEKTTAVPVILMHGWPGN